MKKLIGLGVIGLIALTLSACAPTPTPWDDFPEEGVTTGMGQEAISTQPGLDPREAETRRYSNTTDIGGTVSFEGTPVSISVELIVSVIDATEEQKAAIDAFNATMLPVAEWVLEPAVSVETNSAIAQEYQNQVSLGCTEEFCYDYYRSCAQGVAILANSDAIRSAASTALGSDSGISVMFATEPRQQITLTTALPCAYMRVPLPEGPSANGPLDTPKPPDNDDCSGASEGTQCGISFYSPIQTRVTS